MRRPCLQCVLKHLAKAEAKMTEAVLGYPVAGVLAIGELAEAEEELVGLSLPLAREIRKARLRYANWFFDRICLEPAEDPMDGDILALNASDAPDIRLSDLMETLIKMDLRRHL